MKRIIKLIGSFLLLVVLLLGTAIILLVTLVDQQAIKTKVSQVVQNKTGRQLQINGKIDWSFFPWLGVKVTNVALTNSAVFKNSDFASASELDIQVRPLALFMGRVEVDKFILKNFNLYLIKNSYGATNWQDLALVAAPVSKGQRSTNNFTETAVSNIEISHGHIFWKNQQQDQLFEVNDFNFVSSNAGFKEPFAVTASFLFKDAKTGITGKADWQCQVTLDVAHQIYALQNLQVAGQLQGGIIVNPLDFAGSANINANLQQQNVDISNLKVNLVGLNIVGAAKGIAVFDAPKFAGSLSLANSDLTPILQTVGLKAKATAWKTGSLRVDFETTSKFLKLPKIEISLGDMQLQGNASYSHFTDKYVAFNLVANKVLLDSFMLDTVPVAAGINQNASKPVVVSQPVVVAKTEKNGNGFLNILRAIKLIGDVKINIFDLGRVTLGNFVAQIDGNHGLINCNPCSATFFQGTVNGDFGLDLRQDVPDLKLKLNLSNVDLERLLLDLTNFNKINGVLALDGNFVATGDSGVAMLRSLSGSGKLEIANGFYQGIDLPYKIRFASAAIQHKPMPQQSNPPRTNFGNLSTNYKIAGGIVASENLQINAPDFTATGSGVVNLAMQSIDFRLNATATHDATLFLPMEITNTFADPKVEVNVAALIAHTFSDVITDQIQKQVKVNGKDLKQNLLKILPLDKLFK